MFIYNCVLLQGYTDVVVFIKIYTVYKEKVPLVIAIRYHC